MLDFAKKTFEALVCPLVQGYLGRFIKDIHKEQLKISLWNGEVLLHNVELILESFDYLQLPFALKQGRVGRLSIKIPWTKLGREPIVISLEDVFICVSKRDEQEWSLDAVEKREFAAKKAKLAAAELAKLSRRVCDNQAGRSFNSYITAKILDSIQVSLKNFHVAYSDIQNDKAQIMFGLRFSSLTILKQNSFGSFSGRIKGGQVNKIEILGMQVYFSRFSGAVDLLSFDKIWDSNLHTISRIEGNQLDHILAPFDVFASLSVNRSGNVDIEGPQYSVSGEISDLVLSLDEVQLQQILIIWDYLSTYQLREKYGRYRPWSSTLSIKPSGWQKLWWHYAQESVLSDVRKRLKKTSWKYLGQRLSYQQKYVNLYKTKLDFLRLEQSIDESTLRQLEQMERESDIDDILCYRSTAEHELQEVLSKSKLGTSDANVSVEKSQSDERSSGRSRGWLNWLSHGMLGAGGTDDSSQFSGVISDEVVKDIYEATKFHPPDISNGDSANNYKLYSSAFKFSFGQIYGKLRRIKTGQEIIQLMFDGVNVDCKCWDDFATVNLFIKSWKMLNPCSNKCIICKPPAETILECEQPSCEVQLDVSHKQIVEVSVKVNLQPIEVTWDSELFLNLFEFISLLQSFGFHDGRVLASINGFQDVRARLLSKSEFVLSNRAKVIWDVSIWSIILNIPWINAVSDECKMVLKSGACQLISKNNSDSHASNTGYQSYILKNASKISSSDILADFQLKDLYDLFEFTLNDFEISMMVPQHPDMISVLKKCSSSLTLASCVISDESILKQFEVHIRSSSLHFYLSPTICVCLLQGIVQLDAVYLRSESTIVRDHDSYNLSSDESQAPALPLSINVNVDFLSFEVDFANDVENSTILKLALGQLEICYHRADSEECFMSMKTLKIITFPCRNEMDSLILCSSGDMSVADLEYKNNRDFAARIQNKEPNRRNLSAQACFFVHYQAQRSGGLVFHKCAVYLCDGDLHCYPFLIKLLVGFCEQVSGYDISCSSGDSAGPPRSKCMEVMPTFSFKRFGFSNFLETGPSEYGSISLDKFPFIAVSNDGLLGSLENSLVHPLHEWRKYFNVRKKEWRSPEGSMERGSETSVGQPLDPATGLRELSLSNGHCVKNVVALDLNLCGIKFHFHDSSSIIGTITLPVANCSLLICEEFLDMVCSTEGLLLTSSWWTQNFKDYLWGPSSPDLPPILNVRLQKGHSGAMTSQIEVSIGVQHVCCVLPPEYLSIIIGYFSLPDWSYCSTTEPATDFNSSVNMASDTSVMYKVEVIDSMLIFPVESDTSRYLRLEIPELFFSFVLESTSDNLFNDIYPECLVTPQVIAKRNNCLNIFGRNLILSLLMFKNDADSCIAFDQESKCEIITLIDKLSADVWVRIPCETELSKERSYSCTSVMVKIQYCQLSASDCSATDGFLDLVDVIVKFSSVENISKCYEYDVAQFLQSKKCVKKQEVITSSLTYPTLTEVKCCVDSLSIKLYQSGEKINSPVPTARIDMQCVFSASLRDETLLCFKVRFYSLAVYSLLSSVMLAQCNSTCSTSSVLVISLLKSAQGANELLFILPSIDVWMYIYDWTEVMNLFISYTEKGKASSNINATCGNSSEELACTAEETVAFATECSVQGSLNLIVRSENIGITFHFPVWPCQMSEWPKIVSTDGPEGNYGKVIEVTAHCSGEVSTVGLNTRLKFNLEKVCGSVGICENQSLSSWPFFQISQVDVGCEICTDETKLSRVRVEVNCDRLDMWFSYHIFYFWHDLISAIPESGSPQFGLGDLDIRLNIRKSSLLLTDGRWTCSGPLLEIILKSFIVHAEVTESSFKTTVASDLHVNYNNINKVLWESFVEPWSFQIKITRKHERTALLNSSIITDVTLHSTAPLNLNFTESFFECVFRTMEMVKDACGLMGETDLENHDFLSLQLTKNVCTRRYAPYVLQNLTSLPLAYHVYQGMDTAEDISVSEMNDGNSVQPGSLVPIYLNETPEEQLFRYRPAHSSDRLSEKQSIGGAHHYIAIQLDGTAEPSSPMSMDLVGRMYFEVDFSKVSRNIKVERADNSSGYNIGSEDNARGTEESGFVVPVVFDVSVQRHSKLIRLYSTVILLNATSIPMQLKFEIPFGLSPEILGPVHPSKEFPLPLHLAESGWMKWRPLGKPVLWSEAYNVSNILSQERKTGFLRSVVCYPSMPRSDPFRCCISVKSIILPSSKKPKDLFNLSETSKRPIENYGLSVHELEKSRRRFVHQITFSTPLVVNNYLPEAISLRLESAGDTRTVLLSEIVTPFHHIDPTQDLGLEFHLDGYEPSFLKFPRAEMFTTIGKFSGTKFSLTEIMTFNPVKHNGVVHIIVEKSMDAFSGARELFVFVPFLLYNCNGFPLAISEAGDEMKGAGYAIRSCYELIEQELFQPKTDGLCFLTSDLDSSTSPHIDSPRCPLHDNHITSSRKNNNLQLGTILGKPYILSSTKPVREQLNGHSCQDQKNSSSAIKDGSGLSVQVNTRDSCFLDIEPGKVKPCMYSPNRTSPASEFMVRVSRCSPELTIKNIPASSWSVPFSLVPPSGSTNVFVPCSSPKAAYIICITSSPLGGPLAGRTQAITFQPRYVIANASSKDLCYKQKGTDQVFRLGVGQHSHLHYTDTTRELLVSIRFLDSGWQWSGNFLPDHIGDTQVKMRNYASGSLRMIRVEVQNADVWIRDEQIVGNLHGNSGTNLILLSDDDTGYMPYRIDNFSREKLRIYQQKCETFDTIIHPYTSSPYTWDEPCYPHRLIVEVPGERVVGSYSLDDTKEYAPAYLASTSEKPERTLLLSVHAEGATKVLSIVDSNYHISKDMMGSGASRSKERGKHEQKQNKLADYTENLSLTISDIGISLVDSYPQELLFLSAKNITLDLLQSLDRQKLCFQISALQVDNQLRSTPYPVILSFDREHGSHSASIAKHRDDGKKPISERILQTFSDTSYEPVFNLALAKWRKKDISLVSFEYINLRVADVHLELEQEVVLSLFDLYRTVYSRFQSSYLPLSDPTISLSIDDVALQEGAFTHTQTYVNTNKSHFQLIDVLTSDKNRKTHPVLPSVVPIGAPWQQIHLLARRQKKVYVESLDIAPIKLTVSFSSTPWMLRNGILTSGESVIHRGLMALADVEGARIHLKQLSITHHMASLESVQEILMRHYTRQLLHEIYKVFGSAGVIGNPMGFVRSVGLGVKDFLSVPARSALQSPTGLFTGMAQGTTSLLSNTVYAISDAATQFTKAAHKGIVAFTFDDHAKEVAPHSKGVINEVLEGLTGLLQSPIRGAEKHGLPGVLSGVAMGITGLVARPAASILEVTGKTAQSIRNRSRLSHMGQHRYRVRLPRPLSRELPLRPYSWEEAVGMSVLTEADDDLKFKDEVLVTCKNLKQPGKFVIITERLILVASSSSLEDFGKPEFRGVRIDLAWVIESEVSLESIIHADAVEGTVHIVGSSSDVIQKQYQSKRGTSITKHWSNPPKTLPLFQTNLEFTSTEDAENLLRILLSMIEHGKERGWGSRHLLHQSNLRRN